MPGPEELWMPVVDEPIGSLVAQIQEEDPELDRLVSSPRRPLPFRTFAVIRPGRLLGQLLGDEHETGVERLLAQPEYRAAVEREVRAVAEEIAADPAYAEDESVGPDEETRQRFREFAKKRLET